MERALAEADPRFRPVSEDGGVRLVRPGGGLAHITARGATLSIGRHEVAVRIVAVRRADAAVPLEDASPKTRGAEVQREVAPGITEWWRLLPSGFEHGATLAEPPPGRGPLIVDVQVDGLEPRSISGSSVELRDTSGARVALYSGLVVLDDAGSRVRARMSAADGRLRIDVDDAEARYPLAIDPILTSEEATLLASGGAAGDDFGYSVALSADGSRALVGAPYDDTIRGVNAGSVRVFLRSGATWSEEAILLPAGSTGGEAGWSVALSADGSRALVGVPFDNTAGGSAAGSARVFVRSGTSWSEEATLLASGGAVGDEFGQSVALSGDGSRALIGALFDDTAAGTNAGSARVFVRSGTSWSEEATLLAAGAASNDLFGSSVALSADGTRALVGATGDDTPGGTNAGSAVVFARSGTSWSLEWTLLASVASASDGFGWSVALSADGSRALVGIPYGDTPGGTNAGSAGVFARSGTSWSEEARLFSSGGAPGDSLGWSVSLSADGTRAAAGAYLSDTAGGANAGSAVVFVRGGTTWSEQATLFAADGAAGDELGYSVALSGDGARALVGALSDDTTGDVNAGSGRVFTLAATNGTPCSAAVECPSGFCVDRVCCASACAGGPLDCQACSTAAGGTSDGTCTALSAAAAPTVTCRPSAGLCDVAETCVAGATACPPDAFAGGPVCRPAVGPCDVAETCSGTGATCPPDAFKPGGTPCEGTFACRLGETCDAAGNCDPTSGAATVCADGTICTTDTCSEPAGCEHVPNPGGSCTGELFCYVAATCDSGGACAGIVGMERSCDDGDPCHKKSCNEGLAACDNGAVTDGTSCADGNSCNGPETCFGGTCTAGTPPSCDDGNPCTADSCDMALGCQNASLTGTTCADGNLCNGVEMCAAGACMAGTPTNCSDGDPCTTDSCNPSDGTCSHVTIPSCGDGGVEVGAGTPDAGAGADGPDTGAAEDGGEGAGAEASDAPDTEGAADGAGGKGGGAGGGAGADGAGMEGPAEAPLDAAIADAQGDSRGDAANDTVEPASGGGCGCELSRGRSGSPLVAWVVLALFARRRGRRGSGASASTSASRAPARSACGASPVR